MKYPLHLQKLMNFIRKLPGVGGRSAERFVFHLLSWKEQELQEMGKLISELLMHHKTCTLCGCLIEKETCHFCSDSQRDQSVLCIVANHKQVYALEETEMYEGLYHIMGGIFSPIEGKSVNRASLEKLKLRIENSALQEIIIAFDATLESDATALYLKEELKHYPVKISRLGLGIPVGSCLENLDGGTLAYSLKSRHLF